MLLQKSHLKEILQQR